MTENKSRQPRSFAIAPAEPEAEKPKAATKQKRKPRAVPAIDKIEFQETDEQFFADAETGDIDALMPPLPPEKPRRRFGFGGLVFGAFSFLVAAAVGLYIEGIITDLFAQNLWLGRAALVATAIFVLGIIAFVIREMRAIWKVRSISGLRSRTSEALDAKNSQKIKHVTTELESHCQLLPKTAQARAYLGEHKDDVMDAIDRYAMTERHLLKELDEEAKQLVMNAAKRVSIVTAVSPRALVDIGYVLYENIRLIRTISEHYGGYNGMVGTYALTKRVVTHLAVTGSIAVGDGIIQQLLGHGLAAKLSARLGEGVVNGLMTTRVGLSAIDVCRPAPFHALEKPKISDYASSLIKLTGEKEKRA